jgi:hypothetical protein
MELRNADSDLPFDVLLVLLVLIVAAGEGRRSEATRLLKKKSSDTLLPSKFTSKHTKGTRFMIG